MVLEALGGLIGGVAVAAGAAGKGGEKAYKAAVKAFQDLKESNFDFRALSAPQLRLLGEYFPEVADMVVPEEFRQIEGAGPGREAELKSLGYFEDASREGLGLEERMAARGAQDALSRTMRGEESSILRDLAERGQLGGGDEIAARLAGAQRGSTLAAAQGEDLVRAAISGQRDAALQQGAIGSRLRGEDIDVERTNANTLNRYNELAANIINERNLNAQNTRNRAQERNLGERQRLGDTNRLMRYDVEKENLERKNRLLDTLFGQRLARAQGMAGAYQGLGAARDAQMQTKAQGIMSAGKGAGGLTEGILGGGLGI